MDIAGGKALQAGRSARAEALRWEGEGGFEEGGGQGGQRQERTGEVREVMGARLGGALLGLSLGEGLAVSLASGLQLSTPGMGQPQRTTLPFLAVYIL